MLCMAFRCVVVFVVLSLCASDNSWGQIDQHNYSSCGVRSVYFLSQFLGVEVGDLSHVAALIGESNGVSTLKGVRDGLRKLGLKCEGRLLTIDDLDNVIADAVVLRINSPGGPHFVVYVGKANNNYILIDAPTIRETNRDELGGLWMGESLIIQHVPAVDSSVTRIVVDAPKHVGVIALPRYEPVTVDFAIVNAGTGTVDLGNPVPSCGCTQVSLTNQTLSPGGSTQIVCTIDNLNDETAGKRMYFVDIPVLKPLGLRPVRVEFDIEFTTSVVMYPSRIVFDDAVLGMSTEVRSSRLIDRRNDSSAHAVIESIKPSADWISANIINNQIVQIAITGTAPVGRIDESVEVVTNIGMTAIPVRGEIIWPVLARPSTLIIKNNIGEEQICNLFFDASKYRWNDITASPSDNVIQAMIRGKGESLTAAELVISLKNVVSLGSGLINIINNNGDIVGRVNVVIMP